MINFVIRYLVLIAVVLVCIVLAIWQFVMLVMDAAAEKLIQFLGGIRRILSECAG